MFGKNWLVQSLLGMLLIVPGWLGIAFFSKNFQVHQQAYMLWYMLGVSATNLLLMLGPQGFSWADVVPPWRVALAIAVSGATFGAIANILIFIAVPNAPNQGLPVAISSVSGVAVYIASFVLATLLPRYFQAARFDLASLLGVLLATAGVWLIAVRR